MGTEGTRFTNANDDDGSMVPPRAVVELPVKVFRLVSGGSDFLRKQSGELRPRCAYAGISLAFQRAGAGVMFAPDESAVFLLSNNSMLNTAADRAGKSALDEFLPELNEQRDHRESRIDPGDIQLDPIDFRPEGAMASRQPAATDAGAQLWPMLAAALVGIGVSILAFAAYARFGHL